MTYSARQHLIDKYKELKFWQELLPEARKPDKAREIIIELKREIRHAYKKYNAQAQELESCDRLYNTFDDGQYCTEYRKCRFDNIDDAREYCNEYYWDHQVYSMYDCTGQRFVHSICVAHMKDDVYLVRISWGIDI